MSESADRLQQLLNEYMLRPIDLAERTGINRGTISQYLNGFYAPSRKNAWKIATEFNVNPLWVMGMDVEKKSTELHLTRPDNGDITYKDKHGNQQKFIDNEEAEVTVSSSEEIENKEKQLERLLAYVIRLNSSDLSTLNVVMDIMKDSPERKRLLDMYLKTLMEMNKNGN